MRVLVVLGLLLATGGLTWWLLVHDTRGAEIAKKAALAQRMHASGEAATTIAFTLGISRATVYRVLAAAPQ
jgi:DNA invertase Pin-like site-specific DNA recombinase